MEIKIRGNQSLLEQVNFSVSFVNEDVDPSLFRVERRVVTNIQFGREYRKESATVSPAITSSSFSTTCLCRLCKGRTYRGLEACAHSNDISYRAGIMIPPEFKKQISSDDKKYWGLKQKKTSGKLLLFRCDNEKGAIIVEQYCFCAVMDDRETITVDATPKYVTEISRDGTVSCYENSMKGKKPATFEEALLIGSHDVKIAWEGARTAPEFIMCNMNVANRFGLSSVACIEPDINSNASLEKMMQVYVYLYCKYPVIEQLVKADCKSIVRTMLVRVMNTSKCWLDGVDKDFKLLIDPNETKASKAFNLPTFIVDYVKEVNATNAMISLAKISERTELTKEMFEALIHTDLYRSFVQSSCFANRKVEGADLKLPKYSAYLGYRVDRAWDNLAEIVKYGYKNIEKLLKYLDDNRTTGFDNPYYILRDYLQSSSELIPVEDIDLFPHNLRAAHDRATSACKISKDQETESRVKQIGDAAEKSIDRDSKWYKTSEYDVVFPKSIVDFVAEGSAQSNCVGGYPSRVAQGGCIVFFIRRKTDKETAFVTADYANGRLNQCYYRNNRYVSSPDIREFAEHVAANLKARFNKNGVDCITPAANQLNMAG